MVRRKVKKFYQAAGRLYKYRKRRSKSIAVNFEENLNSYYSGKYKIYSFDVFGTVLTRRVGTCENIFKSVQKQIQDLNLPISEEFKNDFFNWRLNAEKKAKESFYSEGNTIEDIYKTIPNEFNVSAELRSQLINLEIQTEIDNATPVKKVVELINHLHKSGSKVIYISDMYLPKNIIQAMLEKVGAYNKTDDIFVSNEFHMTKSSGTLYEHLLQKFKCKPQDIIHLGDNYYTDVLNAKKYKIKSVHFSKSQYNINEDTILTEGAAFKDSKYSDLFSSMAEAARSARLKQGDADYEGLYKLGADIAGPVLCSFVFWLFKKAQEDGISTLYFLARDGQILMEIAQNIKKRLSIDIDLRYLYVSRQSTLLPALSSMSIEELKWILLKTPYLSLRILANRTECDLQQLTDELEKVRGKKIAPDHKLTDYEIKLLEHLLRNNIVNKVILDVAANKRDKISKYFEQEKLFEKDSYALVDLGWQCSIQHSIEKIFKLENKFIPGQIKGYYFGVVEDTKKRKDHTNREGFYFSPEHDINKKCPISWRAMQILEIFAVGDHGITLDYDVSDADTVVPRLKQIHNEDAYQWGLIHLRLGIFEFLNNLSDEQLKNLIKYDQSIYYSMINKLFNRLILNPQVDEAEALGSYPFKSDQAETYKYQYAPKFTWLKAVQYALFVPEKKRESISTWFRASYRRSRFFVRVTLRVLLSQVFQVPRKITSNIFKIGKKMTARKLRIAVVAYKFPCISETFILNQITGLIDLGHHVDVFAFEKPDKNAQIHQSVIDYGLVSKTKYLEKASGGRMRCMTGAITIILRYFLFYPGTLLRCMDIRKYKMFEICNNLKKTAPFLKKRYDIIHCHFGPVGKDINYINQFLLKTRLVVSFHGYDANRTPKESGKDVYKDLFAYDNHYTVNTNFTRNLVIELGADETKVDVLPVGVKMDRLKFIQREYPEDGIVKFLTVGRLVEKKGHVFALHALKELVQTHTNVEYLLVGDGPLEKELKDLTKELGITQYVKFLGSLNEDDVIELYERSHIFILPSVTASDGDREGQALVLQEAQAMGMPVISTLHNGIPDGVLDGESGFLVEEKNAQALCERMKFMMDNSKQWAKMGKAGRRFVGGKYNIGWLNERLEEIFYKVKKS